MRTKRLEVIKCPKCEMEYLPAEIYLPNELLGTPKYISKDYSGKIIDFTHKSMNLDEKYICDKCGTAFKVSAKISFKTVVDEENDFNEDYSSSMPTQLNLFED